MSVDAGLYLRLKLHQQTAYARPLELLRARGWELDNNGQVEFLPLNDDGMFNWRSLPVGESARVLELLDRKAHAGETLGLGMRWQDTPHGGNFLVSPDDALRVRLTFSPLLHRRVQDGITDASWYTSRIVLPLMNTSEIRVLDWRWVEIF